MTDRISAHQLKPALESTIQVASTVAPQLADRLRWFSRWIADKKLGLLMSKRLLIDFLNELIQDSRLWLTVQQSTTIAPDQFWQQAGLSPPEQYWYTTLFPTWFGQSDPKLHLWTQHMMAGSFAQSDAALIEQFLNAIPPLGGACCTRYILALSMATDLLVSPAQGNSLAAQITTQDPSYLATKQVAWETSLIFWGIQRGLLLSYNPQNPIQSAASLLLQNCNSLAVGCYTLATA